MQKHARHPSRPRTGREIGATKGTAFTLTELLVVIIIMVILASIAIPGFRSMIASSEAARAQTSLRSALKLGRAAAIRSAAGADVAVVFFYTPASVRGAGGGGGTTLMVPCVKVGQVRDQLADMTEVLRDVFVPMRASEPVQMPKGWMIRAYAPGGSFAAGDAWYGDSDPDKATAAAADGNWVFPETGFYDATKADAGASRQTFMVRFAGGTGGLVTGGNDAIVIDPVRDADWHKTLAKWMNPEKYDDAGEFVRSVLRQGDAKQRRDLLGDTSTDTVLVRSVTQLALYEEEALAKGIGAAVDRDTGCLYTYKPENHTLTVAKLGSQTPNTAMIRNWIYGDTNFSGMIDTVDGGDSPQSILYVIDPYRGVPLQVSVQPEIP